MQILFIQGAGDGAHSEDALLAESLRQQLGAGYEVVFPRMPDEDDPDVERWKETIASELTRMKGDVILVGHSVGGSTLLNYLAHKPLLSRIRGVLLLAAPSRDEHDWNLDVLELPSDLGDRLARVPVFLYHCRDDEIVPFAHLALHGARIPRAVVRARDTGGHQFDNDLSLVAADIRTIRVV